MKYALYVANRQSLGALEDHLRPVDFAALEQEAKFNFWHLNGDSFAQQYEISAEALLRLPADVAFSHLYFGQEFCEHLIPSVEDVRTAFYTSRQLNWDFTYVTGPLTDPAWEKVQANLSALAAETTTSPIEVVVNDWGLLASLQRDFPSLVPVLGRLLTKQNRYAWFSDPQAGYLPSARRLWIT